jgi:Ras-related protein Rab-1A
VIKKSSLVKSMNYDYVFRIILIGDQGVGKSCFINVVSDNVYYSNYAPTIGVDFKVIYTQVKEGNRVKCHVWDTAGQEQFHSITRSYFKGVAGAIVMYDTSDLSSFKSIEKWLAILESENNVPNLPKVLVAAKCDKEDIVKDWDVKAIVEKYDMPFIKISSSSNKNVSIVLPSLCEEIMQKSFKNGVFNGIRFRENEKNSIIRRSAECKKESTHCCIIS